MSNHIQNFSQIEIDSLATKNEDQISDQLIEEKDFNTFLQKCTLISSFFNDKYEAIINTLKKKLIFNQQQQYQFRNSTTLLHLQIIQYLISVTNQLNNHYFQSNNAYKLMAVAHSYINHKLIQDKSKIKQLFSKNIKKDSNFWCLSDLDALHSYLEQGKSYFPSYSPVFHNYQLQRFRYLLSFLQNNVQMLPINFDINTILFKIMLCIRLDDQISKDIHRQIKNKYFENKFHLQTTAKNFKHGLSYFCLKFNQKECLFYPQKAFYFILSAYKEQQLFHWFQNSLGFIWTTDHINTFMINCIKLGISDGTMKIINSFIRFAEKLTKFEELLQTYINNISKIFIFLKHPVCFNNSLKLLKIFMLSPHPNPDLYQKFTEKLKDQVQKIQKDLKYQMFNFLQIVRYLYRQTTITPQLDSIINQMVTLQIDYLTKQQMQKQIEIYAWKIKIAKKPKEENMSEIRKYKGLINIGNSCYINSFLQSLFMNQQFKKDILNLSTLELSKNIIKQHEDTGKHNEQLVKTVRNDLRPLAQLQRLFSMLMHSNRPEISPQSLKAVSLPQFHNSFQHDTAEFGRSLLQSLYKNKIKNHFQGLITNVIECQHCLVKRQRKQAFMDLIIGTEEENQLNKLIEKSFEKQYLSDLTCDHCGQKGQKSIKYHFISQFPLYLILTLKRFDYNKQLKKNVKILSKIIIKTSISIQQEQFELYSIIVHRGSSANSGHYFTFSRLQLHQQSKWICHNDTLINILSNFTQVLEFLDSNEEDTPYILFYQNKKHINEIRQQISQPIVLRPALWTYINQDNQKYLNDLKSKPLTILNLPKLNYFFKKDDDEDPNNHGYNNFNHNHYIS